MTVAQLERIIEVLGPPVLAGTSLGAATSRDFAYLYNQVRLAGVAGHAEHALKSLGKASEHMRVLLELVGENQDELDTKEA